jgi:ABC-type hemin transport system substrate-binding protein
MRIISLVPSLTEFLWALGLEQEVVGITKFCVHPTQWWREKTRVGGTKQLHLELIASLEPTLIIANKEENTKDDIEWLQSKYEVLLTDITTLDEAFFYLQEIGKRVGREGQANALVNQINNTV